MPLDAAWRGGNEWTLQTELAAAAIEIADRWGRINAQLQGAKPKKLPPPVEIPRPAETKTAKPKPRKGITLAEFAARTKDRAA